MNNLREELYNDELKKLLYIIQLQELDRNELEKEKQKTWEIIKALNI